jgi:hypothetical protein
MRPPFSLSLIWISRATTSPLPLPPLSRGALGFGDGDHRILDPKMSSPPLPFFSLSLPLLLSPHAPPFFFLLARAPARSRARPRPTVSPLARARGDYFC